ncbi:hypothetical protein SHKM778_28540 [Streptomyces sp. KM77-8]|uniref:Extracellular solute-binding protein n=1 Tax=Streptomyces haneummycinicus TaxID=3074435 RepID=A0AAT9HGI2_9ACTN
MHMNRRKVLAGSIAVLALLASACTGTGSSSKGADAKAPDDPSEVKGTITVLTHRTDLVQDGTMKKYAAEFSKAYPGVKVEFDGLTDYEGEVKIRMNTENYGDVLMIPAVIEKKDYPKFFASLGTKEELGAKYRFTDYSTVDGKVYGQSPIGVVPGFIYNKRVWSEAGVTEWPTTPAEFLAGLKAVKSKTDAVPYYTNFKDMWPLTQWTNVNGSVGCDTGATTRLADGDPWAEEPICASATPCCTTSCAADSWRRTRPPPTGRPPSPSWPRARSPRCGSAPGPSSRCGTPRSRPAPTPPTSASCPSPSSGTASSAR